MIMMSYAESNGGTKFEYIKFGVNLVKVRAFIFSDLDFQ